MARPSKTTKASSSTAAATGVKPRKKRVGDARGRILKALQAGNASRPALQKMTGVSYNALVVHLSKLRSEGVVTFDASNRIVALAASVVPVETASKSSKKAVKTTPAEPKSTTLAPVVEASLSAPIGYSVSHLREALEQFMDRLKPVKELDEKLLVIDQLAKEIGGPIAKVLEGIRHDLLAR